MEPQQIHIHIHLHQGGGKSECDPEVDQETAAIVNEIASLAEDLANIAPPVGGAGEPPAAPAARGCDTALHLIR